MIKNTTQLANARKSVEELKESLQELYKQRENAVRERLTNIEIAIGQFKSQIKEVENEIDEYEALTNGAFHCIRPKSMEDIPECLIKFRIAHGWTQQQLAEKAYLTQQQIAKYESTNYEGASYSRILDVTEAMGLKFYFQEIIGLEIEKNDELFELPSGVKKADVIKEADVTRKKGELLIMHFEL